MRRKNETATSFNQLKEITQAIQAQKNKAQTSESANISKLTPKQAPKPKGAHAKNSALKPTKRVFSERQIIITIRDSSQASIKESKGGANA
ncbi:hypothetical protein JP0554_15090 [Helicobacter pylori]